MFFEIANLLEGKYDNHILPFFWQHGEDEAVLREYMEVIHSSGIGAVCVESRPHPDFCGEKWWKDMDVILEEARKRNMKVWILDDSHFPTGYANGAIESAPEELCRQGICYEGRIVKGSGKKVSFNVSRFLRKKNDKRSIYDVTNIGKQKRVFSGDVLLSVTAIRMDKKEKEIDLTPFVTDGKVKWVVPEGTWKLGICKLSRNCGAHRNYINMMDPDSCRILIDTVYEPHFSHYGEEFGKTIAGFFSDEPELGNGPMYSNEPLGAALDLPWCHTLEPVLEESLGADWKNCMPYLWESDLDSKQTARVRYAYMDAVTNKVKAAFSEQMGEWCRGHGVEYIGHVVEDNNCHARMGGSLGHYFRGLAGQDMAGIDDIGGQVMPQGEDGPKVFMRFMKRDGEFYHYVLAKLGTSLAAIDARKQGRTMCEIFGNYGWAEGLRLERFLADHFMVNGVNNFVPHAFSPKEFPDPDCPPHFYAHGHNPQYKHFRSLMEYMNRVCTLLSGGVHVAPVALLYHAEAEWTGEAMLMQKPARRLLDSQIDYDILPTDVFRDREHYHTDLSEEFRVNQQSYRALVVPYAQFISPVLAEAIRQMQEIGVPVIFLEGLPEGVYEGEALQLELLKQCKVMPLGQLVEYLRKEEIAEVHLNPGNGRVRYLHYKKERDIYYFINEGTEKYRGTVTLRQNGPVYAYHAWDNVLERVEWSESGGNCNVEMELEPYQSCILIFDEAGEKELREPLSVTKQEGREVLFAADWHREVCESVAYPRFSGGKKVTLPDHLAEEMPKFSGWARYENQIELLGGKRIVLVITDAYEGVEVFVNGASAGVQVVPTYQFDITGLVREGRNDIVMEVSTTLERERAAAKNKSMIERGQQSKVMAPTGITGTVHVYMEE